MNKKRWQDPKVPIASLCLKLCEEAAEVGTEFNDMAMDGKRMEPPFTHDVEIRMELEHVRFMCDVIEGRLSA